MEMSNIYMIEDNEVKGLYRVKTYAECNGYWSTSELMSKEQAEEIVKLYGDN